MDKLAEWSICQEDICNNTQIRKKTGKYLENGQNLIIAHNLGIKLITTSGV